jgi:hypothetical protein
MTIEGQWDIPDYIDENGFDFDWRPDPFDPPFIHQFPTAQDKGTGPRFIVEGATDIKYHDTQVAKTKNETGIWEIPDYIDRDSFDFDWRPEHTEPPFIHQFSTSQDKGNGPRYIVSGAEHVKYYDIAAKYKNENGVWEIPDYIDRDSFDFDWRPDIHELILIHQFPTSQDKGDGPRYIVSGAEHVKYYDSPIAKYKNENGKWEIPLDIDMDNFDWQPDINEPLFNHQFPSTHGKDLGPILHITDATDIKYHDEPVFKYRRLDIFFVSNGETGEQQRYDRLCKVAGRRVEWIRGVSGRENALRRAAELSGTAWFILFPGKLSADYNFDFDFQPNRANEPKHYIFYAKNPLNNLVYGHQAAVCYNRQLVLETIDYGLDFTMSKLHDIVPVISGIAEYNSDPIMTWRTAFREVIKLKADGSTESLERLNTWLTYARGQYCEWSLLGAEDGVDYYEQVNGDHSELMKTFSWAWLDEHYRNKYETNKQG